MKFLLLLSLFLTSVRLETDVCPFLKSSDSSLGFGLYRRLSGNPTNRTDRYFLFRKDERLSTRMWEFSIERDSSDELMVRLMGESLESMRKNTTHAFSLEASDDRKLWICSVVKRRLWEEDMNRIIENTLCESSQGRKLHKGFEDELIFRPKPSDSSALIALQKIGLIYSTFEIKNQEIVGTKSKCQSSAVCPDFLETMERESTQLFDRLAEIVDYEVDNSSGHLLLFNIKGQPKYCIHPYLANNGSKCNSEEDLRPLAEHCFPSDTTEGLSGWAIFFITLAVLLMCLSIPFAIWWVCFHMKYTRESDPSVSVISTEKDKDSSSTHSEQTPPQPPPQTPPPKPRTELPVEVPKKHQRSKTAVNLRPSPAEPESVRSVCGSVSDSELSDLRPSVRQKTAPNLRQTQQSRDRRPNEPKFRSTPIRGQKEEKL